MIGPTGDAMEYYRRELVLVALERCHGNRAAGGEGAWPARKILFETFETLAIG